MTVTLNDWAADIHEWAIGNGFYDRADGHPSVMSEKLLLVVSEVAEAQSALRDEDTAHEAEEIADAIIRLLDYSAWRGFDIEMEVFNKMQKNKGRPYLNGRVAF